MARTVHILGHFARHSRVLGALAAGGILFVIGFGASGALMGIRGEGLIWGPLAQVSG
jgi:hypothetical protein